MDFHDLGNEAVLVVPVQLEFDGEAVVEQTPHVAREIARSLTQNVSFLFNQLPVASA